jgi:hypothetical protein
LHDDRLFERCADRADLLAATNFRDRGAESSGGERRGGRSRTAACG